MIDTKQLPGRLVIELRVACRHECSNCGQALAGYTQARLDIAEHVRQAVENAVVGAFHLPEGSYSAEIVLGYRGDFVSGIMRKM